MEMFCGISLFLSTLTQSSTENMSLIHPTVSSQRIVFTAETLQKSVDIKKWVCALEKSQRVPEISVFILLLVAKETDQI